MKFTLHTAFPTQSSSESLWILVDSASCILWLVMGMKLTALLYVLYVIISIYAWFNWRKQLDEERALARAKKKNH